MPTTAPRYKQQGARAPGPKPPGCAQARTRGGRLARGAFCKHMAARAVEGFASQDVVGPASPSVLPDVVCEPTAPYACLPCFDEDGNQPPTGTT